MRSTVSLLVLAVAAAAVVSGQSEVAPSGAAVNPICAIAFRAAAEAAAPSPTPVGLPEPGSSGSPAPDASAAPPSGAIAALDQAVRACASIEDWDAAAALYPEALEGRSARDVLAELCADPSSGLTAYATCRSLERFLATPAPTPVPTVAPGASPAVVGPADADTVRLPRLRARVPGASRVRTFDIDGDTPEELLGHMRVKSERYCGAHAFACTRVTPRVRPRLALRGNRCQVASVATGLASTVFVPRWTAPARVFPELAAWWREVHAYVLRHEGRHIRITKVELAKLRRRLVGRDCARVVPEMQRFNAAMSRAHKRLDRAAADLSWVPPYDGPRPAPSATAEP